MVDVTSHARHDRFGIADALGAGISPPTVRACPSCGALHRDLLAIQTAIRHAWTPRRPRDLRLSRADLAARSESVWQRLIDVFRSRRDALTRALALGLASLGVAGLVLTNVTVGQGSVGFGAASAAASPGTAGLAPVSYPSTAVDATAGLTTREHVRVDVLSVASLAAGGTILGLRRIGSRRIGSRRGTGHGPSPSQG